jgi:penicillin V acylase-like amidase (Ntn superfamily)
LNNQGNNSYAFLKDLVYSNGRMTDSINKKLHAHDKMLENINAKLDDFSSILKNQLSFNKMIETQLAQIATTIPSYKKIEFLANLRE